MARVTVEDCMEHIDNRFELVVLAAQRARELNAGAQYMVEQDDDKMPVIALREISKDLVNIQDLREGVVKNLQRRVENDDIEKLPELIDTPTTSYDEGEEMFRRLAASSSDGPVMHFEDMPEMEVPED